MGWVACVLSILRGGVPACAGVNLCAVLTPPTGRSSPRVCGDGSPGTLARESLTTVIYVVRVVGVCMRARCHHPAGLGSAAKSRAGGTEIRQLGNNGDGAPPR